MSKIDILPKPNTKKKLLGKEFVELADRIRTGGGWEEQGSSMAKIEPISRYWLRDTDDTMRILESMLDKIDELTDVVNELIENYDTNTETNQGATTQGTDRTLEDQE